MTDYKCFGYVRCSTVEQITSLLIQQEKIKKYAEFNNLKEPEMHIESGVSGSTEFKVRKEGKKIWEQLKKGDYLIINKIDRISRNVKNFADIIDYFKTNGIILVCLEPSLDLSSPTGLFVANLLSCVAQLEKQFTVERVNATIKKRKEMKLSVSRFPPFGWTKNEKKELIEVLDEQNVIKQVKEMHEKDKMNYSKIAKKLNELKVLNKTNWTAMKIKRIIQRK